MTANNIIHAPVFLKRLPHQTKITWLKAMAAAGFPFIKLWGCSHRMDLRIPIEKNGITQLRLRCQCYTGRKGNSCGNEGKHPVEGKDKSRSFRINYTPELANRIPLLNWGTPTGEQSGFIVIDIDAGKNGFENLQALLSQHGPLPHTFAVLTGGGGKHLFFKHPGPDWHVKSLADHPELGIGIDVKGEGGYVVAAGSLHHSGNYYRPEHSLAGPADITLAELPEWLLKKIGKLKSELPAQAAPLTPEQIKAMADRFRQMRASSNGKGLDKWAATALERECEIVQSAPTHGNQTQVKAGFRIGGIVGAGLLNYTDALAALLDAANARGGKSSGRVARRSIENGLRSGMLHPRFPTPKDEKVKDALDIALDAWIKSGGKASMLRKIIKPEMFESPQEQSQNHVQENWGEFDRIFGATLDRELQLKQSNPEAFAKWEAEESERQRNFEGEVTKNLSAVGQLNLEERRLKRAGSPLCGNNNTTDSPSTPAASHIASHSEIWHRCEDCPPAVLHRHCTKCADKLGVTRHRPDESRCTRGGTFALRSKNRKERRGGSITLKCGGFGCPKCGYDLECDHLAHHMTISELLFDSIESPEIAYPSYQVEELQVKYAKVKSGCWSVVITGERDRKRYGNKLSKMGCSGVDYIVDYLGNEQFLFLITVGIDFDIRRLNYKSRYYDTYIQPTKISFRERDRIHRDCLSKYGTIIKLSKSIFETCDKPKGARNSYNAVSHSVRLRMPKRMESTGKNEVVCNVTKEHEAAVCEEYGVKLMPRDPRRIDKSYRRGLTQYMMGLNRYEFGEDMGDQTIDAFFAALANKDRIVEPRSSNRYDREHYSEGIACQYSHPLLT